MVLLLNKAQLIKRLKAKDVPVPKDGSMTELKHRLEHWDGGKGSFSDWLYQRVGKGATTLQLCLNMVSYTGYPTVNSLE